MTLSNAQVIYGSAYCDNTAYYQTHATYETARALGSPSTTYNVYVGQNTGYTVNESIIQFDTSVLPADATVLGATLSLYCYTNATSADFDIELRAASSNSQIAGADISGHTLLSSFNTANLVLSDWNVFPTSDAFAAHINTTGWTYILINSSKHRAGTAPTNAEYAYFSRNTTNQQAKLTVSYTMPEIGKNQMFSPVNMNPEFKTAHDVEWEHNTYYDPWQVVNVTSLPQAFTHNSQVTTALRITAGAGGGTNSISNTASYYWPISEYLRAQLPDYYTFSYWGFQEGGSELSYTAYTVGAIWYDSGKTYINQGNGTAGVSDIHDWMRKTYTVLIPAGTYYIEMKMGYENAVAFNYYMTACKIERGNAATAYILPSWESSFWIEPLD